MADFPPNLDDGELWIPSDILLSDVPAPSKTASPPPPTPSFHLPRHFTSSSSSQRFGSANHYALTASPPPYGPPPTTHPTAMFALSSGSAFFYPGPVLYYQFLQPAQGNVLMQTRVVPPQTRFLFQTGISRPESGGTGVFFPRAIEDGGRRNHVLRNKNMASGSQIQRIGEARRVQVGK